MKARSLNLISPEMIFGGCSHYDPCISHNFIQTMLMYKLLLIWNTHIVW